MADRSDSNRVSSGRTPTVFAFVDPDHFLEEHLWKHVAMAHVPRVFLWTFGALLAMHLLLDQLHLEAWLQSNQLIVLLALTYQYVGLLPDMHRRLEGRW